MSNEQSRQQGDIQKGGRGKRHIIVPIIIPIIIPIITPKVVRSKRPKHHKRHKHHTNHRFDNSDHHKSSTKPSTKPSFKPSTKPSTTTLPYHVFNVHPRGMNLVVKRKSFLLRHSTLVGRHHSPRRPHQHLLFVVLVQIHHALAPTQPPPQQLTRDLLVGVARDQCPGVD
jgi:hypothetical protein